MFHYILIFYFFFPVLVFRTNFRYACTGLRLRLPLAGLHATHWNPLKFQRFCCPCALHRSALHSFARFLRYGTQQKSETLRPHRVRTSRQKLSASTVTSCFFAFNKPLNYIYRRTGMQAFFEMFFEYF